MNAKLHVSTIITALQQCKMYISKGDYICKIVYVLYCIVIYLLYYFVIYYVFMLIKTKFPVILRFNFGGLTHLH